LIDSLSQALERFLAFLARELAPSRRRVIEAARNAAKSTVTSGMAASMQILGPFGPLFAFRIGQPGISLGITEGAITILFAAVMQAAIVPITGKLLDYPGLIMAFLFIVFTAVAYLLSNARLFLILALVAIGTITTVYVGIFEPGQIGWGSTYTFDGILVATLVMVAFDTLIWPSPPEPRLLESIAADFERTRRRFKLVGQRYLDPFAPPLPAPQVTSMLPRNLALLNSVKQQMKPTSQRLAALLGAVMTAEHVYLEVERLAVLADEPVSGQIRQNHRDAIEVVLLALDKAFAEITEDTLAGLPDRQEPPEWTSDLRVTIQRLSELTARVPPASDEFTPPDLSNLLGFVGGLETIGSLLESRERPSSSATAEPTGAEADPEPHPFLDPVAFRFSVKLGAAITLGLLVGLTTQRADLQTILWSTVVAGQPNQYGAVVRKTLLRLAGCILGGLAALAAMILVSENFDSLPPYLVAIFAVTMFSTYVAQSSEWLGYAGIQAGITFLICYLGLAPASDVYRPLWRFWGIILGVLTSGFVFLLLWPEYASDKTLERLRRLMRTTLAFAKEVAQGSITEGRVAAVEQRLNADLLDVLTMADQARFEGRRGAANSTAAIQAAAIIIRIAYRFGIIARGRLSGSKAPLSDDVLHRLAAVEETFCTLFGAALEKFELAVPFERPDSLSKAPLQPAIDLEPSIDELTVLAALEGRDWSSESRSVFVTQLESYRRLVILLRSLDVALSNFSSSSSCSPRPRISPLSKLLGDD
jgi:uncharacterized membrane protein YccC